MKLLNSLRANVSKILNVNEISVLIRIYENSSGVVFTLEEFLNHYNPEEIQKGQCNLQFKIDCNDKTVVAFQLKDMYNCSGIIVGSDLMVNKGLENKGLGTTITKFMMDFSKHYGYGVLQAADKVDNQYQRRIFLKLGWLEIFSFVNPKTSNNLTIWMFKIN